MDIIIHRRDILPHNPCANGLDWFDDMVRIQRRQDSLRIPQPLGLLWLCCNPKSSSFVAWARSRGVLPAFCGAGLDLRSLDLYEANLEGANFEGANLRRTNLWWADLGEANLYRADLEWADLYRANLEWADLRGANLYGADLYGANLEGARRRPEDPPIPGWKVVNGLLTKE